VRRLPLISAALFFCASIAPAAHAQAAKLSDLAARTAQSIAGSNLSNVMVFDFSGPGKKETKLGAILADEFSSAMAQSDPQLKIIDRDRLLQLLTDQKLLLSSGYGLEFQSWEARNMAAGSFVTGRFELLEKGIKLHIEVYAVAGGHQGARL
jgi:hypothetical protein